jgi:hypothetical protein
MDPKDVYRSAKLYIDLHGGNAEKQAAARSAALLKAGDPDGANVWTAIRKAINELRSGVEGKVAH